MFFDMINYAYYLIPCIHLYTRPTLVSNNKSLQLDHWNFLILYLTYAICVCGRGKHSWFAAFTVCTNCRYLEIGIEIAAKIISIRNTTHINPKGFLMGFSVIPRSPQTFRPVPAMKLLGIMFKYRCWPTTFHTITAGDANGWCYNWLVRSASHAPITPNFFIRFQLWNCWGLCLQLDVAPPLFTLLQPEMPTDGVITGWCDRPLMPRSHQTFFIRFQLWNCWGLCLQLDVGPPLFTLLQPEIPTYGVGTDRCDRPLMPRPHQTLHSVLAVKLLMIMFRDRCWPTTFLTITAGDADG